MAQLAIYFTVLIVLVDAALVLALSTSDSSYSKVIKIKKKKKESRSTSSSSRADKTSDSSDNTLSDGTGSSITSSASENTKKDWPKSSIERHGWRKWHRKCPKCLEDARKKWKDPTIKWICGAYQRARRSFKSTCMMRYRNCQDGTMFVKVHDHRCRNDTNKEDYPHGDHFFYEYKVKLSDESEDSKESTVSTESESETSSY